VRLHGGVSASKRCREAGRSQAARPADLCYIQFSSGSTRHPHGVQITQAALMANLAGITGPAGLESWRAIAPRAGCRSITTWA
jgi:fatty-acyl-CoA synthase